MPPCDGRSSTLRVRLVVPPPQLLVHTVSFHTDMTQSWGHANELHLRHSNSGGQPAPPWSGTAVMLRTRDCTPPLPHDLEHFGQLDQLLTAQSTAHLAPLSQAAVWFSTGHATPPCAACRNTERVRTLRPTLHVLLQAEKAVHDVTRQLMGHLKSLQARLSCTGAPSSAQRRVGPPRHTRACTHSRSASISA